MSKIKIKYLEKYLAIAVCVFSISYSGVSFADTAIDRATLLEKNVELPSERVTAKVMRVKFTPGFKTPWHTHEGPGPRYVVKGILTVVEDGKTNIYKAGDVFWESGALMSVENTGKEPAELIIFEIAPEKK